MCAESQPRHIDVTLLIDLQEGEATTIKTGALKIGELIRGGNNGVRIRSTAKREIQQRHAANGTLFDHPRHFAVQPFVQQDSWNHRADSEAKVDHIFLAKLQRCASCNDLIDSPFNRFKIPQGPEDLATY